MTITQLTPPTSPENMRPENSKMSLNKRLESIGWGFFLILLGCQAFIPNARVNEGYWSIGVGLILLGLNAARYLNQIRMSGFSTVLGIIALITGFGELAGADLPGLAILLIILGLYLLVKPRLEERQIFGKAEEG